MKHRPRMHTLRSNVVATAVLSALASPLALSQDAPAGESGWEILAVDPSGAPVPDVALTLVDTVRGSLAAPALNTGRRTDEAGRIAGSGAAPYVLDVVSRDPEWTVAFVHGTRTPDESSPEDLLGERLHPIDLSSPAVCVLERTGTIRVRVEGAAKDDRFHVAFADERPEPALHRPVRSAASFSGATGALRARAGRGTLYIARDGALGAPVLSSGRPLLVAVRPGATTEVSVRLEEGPTTTLLAPFDTIPFERVEALTPDGAIVVADIPFESSPLRIRSALPIASGTTFDPEIPMAVRLPKHLLRAAGVRVGDPLGASSAASGTRPGVDRAPTALDFPVDLGARVRFPEVESGWLRLAREGLMVLGGSTTTNAAASATRSAAGRVRLDAMRGDEPAADAWSVVVTTTGADSAPAPFCEVLVVEDGRGRPALRAITDAAGALSIEGIASSAVHVAPLRAPSRRVTVTRGSDGGTVPVPGDLVAVSGRWRGAGDDAAPIVGGVLVLISADPVVAANGRAYGTRAFPVAIADATGAFRFTGVAPGEYVLRTDRATEHPITITADATLEVVGAGGDEGVAVSPVD